MSVYAPFAVQVRTPRLTLVGATDEWLERLAPQVRAGKAGASPDPYDDPISLYETDPDVRVDRWWQGIWRGRGLVSSEAWRLYFVVVVDDEPVGMQDLIGHRFSQFRSVTTFSWLSADQRGRGLGREMREAVLHLAFAGLGASQAVSEAFGDNRASNGVSMALGYERNGTDWDSRRGEPAVIQRWLLPVEVWNARQRTDFELDGVADCRRTLGI